MTAPQTTDPQSIIAAFQERLDAGLAREAALAEKLAAQAAEMATHTAESADRKSEFDERIGHQAATIDVLRVMAASPSDTLPVFNLITRRAAELCESSAALYELREGQLDYMAGHGMSLETIAAYRRNFPRPLDRSLVVSRAILERRTIHVQNVATDTALSQAARDLGGTAIAAIPLLRDGEPIGAVALNGRQPGGFSESQIALLQTFAEQAVIAITSAETYRALQTRTSDLQESLEYQTATSDVLKVISRSTFDLQPILDTLVKTATRLCDADMAAIGRPEGDLWRLAANFGFPPEFEGAMRARGAYPLDPDSPTVAARAVRERRAVHIHDAAAVPGYPDRSIGLGKQRTSLGVPLLREGEAIGHIVLARQRVEPFTERQIELVSTFADQAVIAIENTRLITEQREALEQQTATAEVLQVINASPGNLAPVFDAILEKAHDLCGATKGALVTFDGQHFRAVVTRGLSETYAQMLREPRSTTRGSLLERLLNGARFVLEDTSTSPLPLPRAATELEGVRTVLIVPLRRDSALLGYITALSQEVRPFTEKHIALLQNFAAQAVIAMENARLITEQREALEQQTATAEVLQVINASPGDLAPVFDAILEKAHHLCGAVHGVFGTYNGDYFRAVASRGLPAAVLERLKHGFHGLENPITRPLFDGARFVQIPDLKEIDHPMPKAVSALGGFRTALFVPLRKDGTLLGHITALRSEVRPFTDKQIALLQNFAAQAVIAMENARLITEQREALEQQTATAEVLQVINASPGNLAPVFDAMLEKATRLCEAGFGSLYTYDGDRFQSVAQRGVSAAYAAYRERHPPELVGAVGLDEVIRTRRAVQVTDMMAEMPYLDGNPNIRAMVDLGGMRSAMVVPLCKDETALGVISVFRQEVRPFSDKQVALLENFAAQAVIAMENARLITEQREALEQQTATAEVLQVINASPGNLVPVFDAMLEKAMRLLGAAFGLLYTRDGDDLRFAAQRGVPAAFAELRAKQPPVVRPGSALDRLYATNRPVHVLDLMAEPDSQTDGQPAIVVFGGARTLLMVPLRKDATSLGHIALYRQETQAFSDKQIALLENFAAQAVIAMENARLITETREALERQTATAEVLRIINENPGNLGPVFDVILEKALSLAEAAFGSLWIYHGDTMHAAATRGMTPALAEFRARNPVLAVPPVAREASETRRAVQMLDIRESESYRAGRRASRAIADLGGARTNLVVPLLKDNEGVGCIQIYRQEVRVFTPQQISLLEGFAAQAVIAMDNARLLNEIRQRQNELDITFENMGDGVAMFDRDHRLAAWNRNFQDILNLPDEAVRVGLPFADYIRGLAARGEYGPDANADEQIARLTMAVGQANRFERTRPNGRVIDVRHNPIQDGGFVVIYADITERKRAEEALRVARDEAETALRELKVAQANLIQAEKMASLGQLTAGIAHEIKNPLNFVNNFSALSTELIDELRDVLAPEPLGETARTEVNDLTALLKGNLEKVVQHGQRADGIVRSMLDHSRGSSGERRMVDLNALIDEALNLAYHGARAQDQSFNITLERGFGEGIAPIEVNPQDITRVFLNLFSNGFYAATSRAREGGDAGFVPMLKVTTIDAGDAVEIRVRDNGIGIPADIRDKLFQPFFTTKPTGEGTGLGLSITYDIVTQQHGGSIAVDSNVGEYSEFTILLPREP